jgi:glycosyltransferase involved in cell wall biosynthesis
LPAQLSSFAHQSFTDWRLFVSDDGSTDETRAILARYSNSPAVIRDGPRQGFVANFLSLACDPAIAGHYFAYSDQDDIWEPDKLARAVRWIDGLPSGVPGMYCSRTSLIDEHDRPCGFSPLFRRQPSFRNALVQSIAGGNTIVFNQATRELLMRGGSSAQVPSHDWWTYLLTTAVGGQVHYDAIPTVRYRMHGENAVGSNVGWDNRLQRLKMLRGGQLKRWTDMNTAALTPFRSHMTSENRDLFDLFCASRKQGFIGRQIGFLRTGVYRQTRLDGLGLILAMWTKKI